MVLTADEVGYRRGSTVSKRLHPSSSAESTGTDPATVVEAERRTPVAGSYDVAVVGAGLSGLIAAIAAGRAGAATVMLDRFGMVGGNLGPAMIVGGSVAGEAPVTLPGGIAGIPRELVEAMEALKLPAAHRYADETNIIPYLGTKWAREAGVDLLLPVWAADPIVEDGAVTGLFVEGKGGRVAVRATVVIDASADADVCRRAGVPVVTDQAPDPNWPVIGKNRLDPAYVPWNDTAIYFVAGGVDFARFRAFAEGAATLSEEDERWLEEMERFPISTQKFERPMIPLLRRAWQDGSFRLYKSVEEHVHLTTPNIWKGPFDGGLAGSRINLGGAIRRDDMWQHARLETEIRQHVFETVQFYRAHVPGFEQAYLLITAPYFGSRGGPHIDAERTITPYDVYDGRRFDDVVFVNTHSAQPKWGAAPAGFDTPYRTLIPRGLDGLMATGRASGYLRRGHDPGSVRARPALLQLGEVCGLAAAMAVRAGVAPRSVDVKALQRELVARGFHLGGPERLRELGLE